MNPLLYSLNPSKLWDVLFIITWTTYFQAIKLLGLLCAVTFFAFPPLESVLMLYCALVMSECASDAWNSVTRADASNLERIQRKILSLCLCRFPNHLQYNYVKVSNFLNSLTLIVTRIHLAAPFLIKLIVYDGYKILPFSFGNC